MENTSYLYDTLVRVLSQHANWLDLRHLKTLAWMMVGLINSYSISLVERFVSPYQVKPPVDGKVVANRVAVRIA